MPTMVCHFSTMFEIQDAFLVSKVEINNERLNNVKINNLKVVRKLHVITEGESNSKVKIILHL
jgi:hypothetical protein